MLVTSNEHPEDAALLGEREILFPPRLEGRRRLTLTLPRDVEAIYTETYEALCGGSRILAGIGIRALVEIGCRKKRAGGRSLEKRIEKLVELGLPTLAEGEVGRHQDASFLRGVRRHG